MLKRNRRRVSLSGSIARMRALAPAHDATKNENNPTLAPMSTNAKG